MLDSAGTMANGRYARRFLATIALAGLACAPHSATGSLENEAPQRGELTPRTAQVEFRIDLPTDVVALTLDLDIDDDPEIGLDLELFAPDESETGDDVAPFESRTESTGVERLRVDFQDGLHGGRWTARVRAAGRLDAPVQFALSARWQTAPVREIETGRWIDLPLRVAEGKLANLAFEIPADARSLHVRLGEANGDYDLRFSRAGRIDTDGANAEQESNSARYLEQLDVENESGLRRGRAWLQILLGPREDPEFGEDDSVRLGVSFNAPLPWDRTLALPPFAPLRELEPGLARAVAATVELATESSGGTGTVVHSDGLVLTNAHVLDLDLDGEPQADVITVGFVERPDLPPRPRFEAEVVAIDIPSDLALLRLVRTAQGEPVRPPLGLVALELAERPEPRLGDPLSVLGFPSLGGPSYRVNITLTRGIVSGFISQRGAESLIASDATIGTGNSGGAAFDRDWQLVAIPTFAVTDEIDSLGFFRRIDALPAGWRDRIARGPWG